MAKRGPKPKQISDNLGNPLFPTVGVVRRGRPPKSDGESVSGYFRRVYEERPDLLTTRSNDETLLLWLRDHPGEKQVPERVKQILSNLKSVMRRKARPKRGRKPGVRLAAAVTAPPPPASTGLPRKGLQALEEHIDESLTLAKNLDREGLEGVITALRQARNEVVWKIGQ